MPGTGQIPDSDLGTLLCWMLHRPPDLNQAPSCQKRADPDRGQGPPLCEAVPVPSFKSTQRLGRRGNRRGPERGRDLPEVSQRQQGPEAQSPDSQPSGLPARPCCLCASACWGIAARHGAENSHSPPSGRASSPQGNLAHRHIVGRLPRRHCCRGSSAWSALAMVGLAYADLPQRVAPPQGCEHGPWRPGRRGEQKALLAGLCPRPLVTDSSLASLLIPLCARARGPAGRAQLLTGLFCVPPCTTRVSCRLVWVA